MGGYGLVQENGGGGGGWILSVDGMYQLVSLNNRPSHSMKSKFSNELK